MKRYLKKATALLLAVSILVVVLAIPASAALGRSSLYLSCYRAWLTPKNNGTVRVTIDVQAVGDMDDVGAIEVDIYESSDGGSTWALDNVYASAIFPELLLHDTYLYYESPIDHIGRPGNKYFAIVTVYAGDSTGNDSREYQTTTITAKWQGD